MLSASTHIVKSVLRAGFTREGPDAAEPVDRRGAVVRAGPRVLDTGALNSRSVTDWPLRVTAYFMTIIFFMRTSLSNESL
jgi:hypothetical protein